MRKELPRNGEGKKMYPVCSWEKNQHKIYNANDRVRVLCCENRPLTDEEHRWIEKVDRAMEVIDSHVYDGIVYATWEDGQILKDIIYGYNARH